ncbi:MAG: relaxase/mobilization nuclease domain-containing protein [Janthinobacterium lividum]
MIAHAITGDSFRAVCAYLCQESKNAEVLAAEGVRTDSAQHMAEDFTFQQQLRPNLGKAVFHIALSLRPEDAEGRSPEEVSTLLKAASRAYQEELAKKIGPLKTQWLLVQHFDKDHPHAHLVMNRVDDHGQVIPDSFIGEHSRRACQQVEQQLGLATAEEQGREQARREGPTNRQMAADTPRKVRMADWQRARHTVANALQPAVGNSGDFGELADKLSPQRIKQVVSEHRHKNGSTRYGVRYEYNDHRFKGGEVGPQFTAPKLLEGFAQVQAERQAQAKQQVTSAIAEITNLFETGRLNALLKEGAQAAEQRTVEIKKSIQAPLQPTVRVARSLPALDKSDELEM